MTRSALNFPNPFTQTDINFNGAGDNTIVAGATGKQTKVFRLKLVVAGATSISIKDGAGTVLDGPWAFGANQGIVLDFTGIWMPPWYTTLAGNDFIINSTNAVQVGGNLDYVQS